MTKLILNQTLENERQSTRKYLFQMIASKMLPPVAWTAIRDNMANSESYTILQEMFLVIQPYTSQIPHSQWDEAKRRALQVQQMQLCLSAYLHGPSFKWLLEELHDILLRNIDSQDTCSESVRKIKERLDEYAEKLYTVLKDIDDNADVGSQLFDLLKDRTDFDLSGRNYASLWTDQVTSFPIWSLIKSSAFQVGRDLASSQLDDSVKRYVINQDIGSCGMYTESLSNSVLMAPFMVISIRDKVIDYSRAYLGSLVFSESKDDALDEYQQHLEERAKNYIRSKAWRRFTHESSFRSVAPTRPDTPVGTHGTTGSGGPTQSGNTGTSQSNTSGTQPSGGTVPPTSVPPTTSAPSSSNTIPDDDNYEPDGLLAARAADYTALVRSKPATEKFHDHMERFGVTDETPRVVSYSDVISGVDGADFTVQTRIRGVKSNYMVTYTRKSRKPIFSPLVGSR